ncbi:hypothetical protein [Limoniibacter endophyticus]|nr:hypothetical protein [Limoniibacter endophyticus]
MMRPLILVIGILILFGGAMILLNRNGADGDEVPQDSANPHAIQQE